jgi:hypothetical protein
LPPGSYALSIEQAGFKRYKRPGVTFTGGQLLRVDVAPEVGAVSATVSVYAELPPVNVMRAVSRMLRKRRHEGPVARPFSSDGETVRNHEAAFCLKRGEDERC